MAEKTIDLTPKADKITDEQLQELQLLLNEINKNQLSIGQLETQKASIIEGVGQLQLKLREIQASLATFINSSTALCPAWIIFFFVSLIFISNS